MLNQKKSYRILINSGIFLLIIVLFGAAGLRAFDAVPGESADRTLSISAARAFFDGSVSTACLLF